jgi:hypothetical protein
MTVDSSVVGSLCLEGVNPSLGTYVLAAPSENVRLEIVSGGVDLHNGTPFHSELPVLEL